MKEIIKATAAIIAIIGILSAITAVPGCLVKMQETRYQGQASLEASRYQGQATLEAARYQGQADLETAKAIATLVAQASESVAQDRKASAQDTLQSAALPWIIAGASVFICAFLALFSISSLRQEARINAVLMAMAPKPAQPIIVESTTEETRAIVYVENNGADLF